MLLYHIQVSYLLLCICIGIQSHVTDSDKEAFCDAYILLYREIVTGQTVNDIDFSRRHNAVTQRRSLSLKKKEIT